jgi:hypothetical protein
MSATQRDSVAPRGLVARNSLQGTDYTRELTVCRRHPNDPVRNNQRTDYRRDDVIIPSQHPHRIPGV